MNATQAVREYQANPEYGKQAEDQLQAILARSATDKSFRQKLLTDPRAAVAEFAGKPVSEVSWTHNVVFIENKADVTLVLPDPVSAEAELSDSELETVAGGLTPLCVIGIVASALWVSAEVIGAIKDAR